LQRYWLQAKSFGNSFGNKVSQTFGGYTKQKFSKHFGVSLTLEYFRVTALQTAWKMLLSSSWGRDFRGRKIDGDGDGNGVGETRTASQIPPK